MIPNSVVHEVQRLLRVEGLSQRKVAMRLGVSRGSVHAIAQGKRNEPTGPRLLDPGLQYDRPPERCPECGGLVYMPCLLCRIRTLRRSCTGVRRVG